MEKYYSPKINYSDKQHPNKSSDTRQKLNNKNELTSSTIDLRLTETNDTISSMSLHSTSESSVELPLINTIGSLVKNRIGIFEFTYHDARKDTLKLALKSTTNFYMKFANPKRSNPLIRVNDFSLICTLGSGSFGRVLLAFYKCDRKFYALKVI